MDKRSDNTKGSEWGTLIRSPLGRGESKNQVRLGEPCSEPKKEGSARNTNEQEGKLKKEKHRTKKTLAVDKKTISAPSDEVTSKAGGRRKVDGLPNLSEEKRRNRQGPEAK